MQRNVDGADDDTNNYVEQNIFIWSLNSPLCHGDFVAPRPAPTPKSPFLPTDWRQWSCVQHWKVWSASSHNITEGINQRRNWALDPLQTFPSPPTLQSPQESGAPHLPHRSLWGCPQPWEGAVPVYLLLPLTEPESAAGCRSRASPLLLLLLHHREVDNFTLLPWPPHRSGGGGNYWRGGGQSC